MKPFSKLAALTATLLVPPCLFIACGKDSKSGSSSEVRAPISARVQCTEQDARAGQVPVSVDHCLQAGGRVVDAYNTVYVVSTVYADGRIEARPETAERYASERVLPAGQYSPEVFSIEGYSLNAETSEALDTYNIRLHRFALYANGVVRAQFMESRESDWKFLDIRDMTPSVPKYGAIQRDSLVLDAYNSRYRVLVVYADGRIYAEHTQGTPSTRRIIQSSEVTVATQTGRR